MSSFAAPPLFARLASAERVLVAGAGGGFDLYAGLPIALALRPGATEHRGGGARAAVLYLPLLERTETIFEVAAVIEAFHGASVTLARLATPH